MTIQKEGCPPHTHHKLCLELNCESGKAKDFQKIQSRNLPGMAVVCSGKFWGISYCIAFTLKMHFDKLVEAWEIRERIKTAKRIYTDNVTRINLK